MFGRICCSEHLLGQIYWSDQYFRGPICWSDHVSDLPVRSLSRICGSDHVWSDMLFGASIGTDLLVRSVFLWSDLLVRSRVGSACQIRFKSNLWFRSYLVGYAVQTILGQICWSDQLVGSGKSDLWFRSCLVGYAVQSIYWVRSVGQISIFVVGSAGQITCRICLSDQV